MDSNWKASDVFKILINPAYAGIGPFDMFIEGKLVKDCVYPAIISDKQWLEAQESNVLEAGARSVLLGMRREVLKSTGVKVDAFYEEGWLDHNISRIKTKRIESVFREILLTLRPKSGIRTSEDSRIISVDITNQILEELSRDETLIHRISPDQFENLILNRLLDWGFSATKTGATNRKDGGIDLIATHPSGIGLLGVQIKHHRQGKTTSSKEVRDFLGAVTGHSLHMGMLVTNTAFTPDAKWFAENKTHLIKLRDQEDLKRWIKGEFLVTAQHEKSSLGRTPRKTSTKPSQTDRPCL